MKLLTKGIQSKLPALYSQDKVPTDEQVAQVKFFDPMGSWTWYGIEYDPETRTFFGYVKGIEDEYGYFTLDELESIGKGRMLGIERDLHFKPTKMANIK